MDSALEDAFGSRWKQFEGSTAVDVQSSEDVRAFLREHPDIEALSTHLGRPPVPRGFFPIAFLRNPVERSASVHRYLFRKLDAFNETDLAFPEWVDWALRNPAGLVIRNYQVVHFSSASFVQGGILNAIATETHLAEAIDAIASWSFVGIVSEFSRSIDRFNECYREPLEGKQLKAFQSNVTREDASGEHSRVEEIRSELGNTRFRRLVDANELDFRFYAYVKSKFFESA